MSKINMNRRQFIRSAAYSGLLYGTGSFPGLVSSSQAMPATLQNRVLIDLFLEGGPDFRHLVVPDPNSTFGAKYWLHRRSAHRLNEGSDDYQQSTQDRWNNDYYHFTVGDNSSNWNNTLVDQNSLNNDVTFGIWREAGWLIDMFRAGNVALVFNAVGGDNRAHDLSSLQLQQGNVFSTLNQADRSGWGGRLARSAGGNTVSLTNTPSPFCFGPLGSMQNYNPNAIDNSELLSIENSREIGLYDFDINQNQYRIWKDRMARAAKSYYAGLRQEQTASVYDKALQHEENVRRFGLLIEERLADIPEPQLIQALYNSTNDFNINPGPSNNGTPLSGRKVLRSYNFGQQIRNLYDILAVSDLESFADPVQFPDFQFQPRVLSMEYGGWDSHDDQRQIPATFASDPNSPYANRGIESGLRDIFGGQWGNNPVNSSSLHYAFSALWANLPSVTDREKLVITVAGEFGRQIRNNGTAGTDHGRGNLMMVIGENVSGGLYGDMFPEAELPEYDRPADETPDIEPLTEIDQLFSKVCDWVVPNSGTQVFPRVSSSFSGDAPMIEVPNMFNNLFTS